MVTGELKAWLSVEETAELLGVHTNTVYTYLASKQIPAKRLGRKWIISRNAITRWLEGTPAVPETHISDTEYRQLFGGKSK